MFAKVSFILGALDFGLNTHSPIKAPRSESPKLGRRLPPVNSPEGGEGAGTAVSGHLVGRRQVPLSCLLEIQSR